MSPRSTQLIEQLGLVPHPEGGWFREVFRSTATVQPADARPPRAALTTIDFLLQAGQHSAWHRVASDEAWHWLEGEPLVLHLVPPSLDRMEKVVLAAVDEPPREARIEQPVASRPRPRHVVPAGWWQAAEPLGAFAYVGATVGPGFDFADFAFGREHAVFVTALASVAPQLQRLL